MVRRLPVCLTLCVFVAAIAGCEQEVELWEPRRIATAELPYTNNGIEFTGYLAEPADAAGRKLPGVLVIHEWWGHNAFARKQAERLARMGYVAYALDMYGDRKVTTSAGQARLWAEELYGDPRMRSRAKLGLEQLKKHPNVDTNRLAAIGFCFGGTAVIELAYSGADLDAAVSFHGNPQPAQPDDTGIEAKILICHGEEDPHVSDEQLEAFEQAAKAKGIDYTILRYPQAQHSFTNPRAAEAGLPGVAYNSVAAEKAWQDMQQFFIETMGEVPQIKQPKEQ